MSKPLPKGEAFIGINGPVSLKSEMMTYDAVEMPCGAFLMEEVQSVTYQVKQ